MGGHAGQNIGIPAEEIILTDVQREVCEMLMTNRTETEIAVILNKSRAAVAAAFKTALRKLGAKEIQRRYNCLAVKNKVDYQLRKNPEKYKLDPIDEANAKQKRIEKDRRALEVKRAQSKFETPSAAGKPTTGLELPDGDAAAALLKLLQVAKQSGVAPALVDGLGHRIMKGVTEVEMMPENFKDEDLRAEIHKKIRMVLAHVDQSSIGGAKLTDLSTMFKTLQEQAQLLDGKPTAILSIEDKQGLNDIADKLRHEMARREGKVVNGSCEEVKEDTED